MTYYEAQSKGKCSKCNRDCIICKEDDVCYNNCTVDLVINMTGLVNLRFPFKDKTEANEIITAALMRNKEWFKIGDVLINRTNINYIKIEEEN